MMSERHTTNKRTIFQRISEKRISASSAVSVEGRYLLSHRGDKNLDWGKCNGCLGKRRKATTVNCLKEPDVRCCHRRQSWVLGWSRPPDFGLGVREVAGRSQEVVKYYHNLFCREVLSVLI